MSPQSIDALRSLAHQHIPRAEYDAICLLLFILYRNKPHARPSRRLADCFGISCVVLLSLHERLDIRWRYEPDRVTQFTDLSSPIVGPATRLQRYQAPRLGRQEINQFRPGDLLSEHRLPRRASTMRLENMLRDIQTNRANRRHGRLPHVVSSTPHSGTSMPASSGYCCKRQDRMAEVVRLYEAKSCRDHDRSI